MAVEAVTAGEALFLGVDGGGTRCRARVRDASGRLVGEGEAGSANVRRGVRAAMDAVVAAATAAIGDARLLGRLHAGVGLAGVSQRAQFAATLAEPNPFASFTLATDFAVACLGAHGGGDGGLVIAGTGSAAYARIDGREHRFGGWGFEVGDDGGAAPLGRAILRHSLRAADGLEPAGPLADAVLAAVGGDPDAAVEWVGRSGPADFGRLAPFAFAHAADDPEAARLVAETGGHVSALILRLVACGAGRVALTGGLAAPVTPYLAASARGRLVPALADPADGAIALARAAVGAGA
jgi:glucosamine kinase